MLTGVRQIEAMIMADWSHLPYDLLILIANLLYDVADFLRFSAVCRTWRLVYLNKTYNPVNQTPLLVLCEEYHFTGSIRRIYEVSRSKIHRLPFPVAPGCRSWGSPHGWIVTVNQALEISLLNPITQVRIDLPPYSRLHDRIDCNTAGGGWFGTISAAHVFKILQDIETVAIYGKGYNLGFVRSGDRAWTTLNSSTQIRFITTACYGNQILALSMVGTLFLIENPVSNSPRALFVATVPDNEKGWDRIYLVESSGDLLLVLFYQSFDWSRMWFKLYRFDCAARKWTAKKELDGRALLVDDYSCISVPASGYFKSNRIYHARDSLDSFGFRHGGYGRKLYMNVFIMKDESCEIHLVNANPPACYNCPVWLLPNLW